MMVSETEWKFPSAKDEFPYHFLAYRLSHFNGTLIFPCYMYYEIRETAWWLKGGESEESEIYQKTLETIVGCDRFLVLTGKGSSGGIS